MLSKEITYQNNVFFSNMMKLSIPDDKVIAEYIWIGGSGSDLRSKSKVLKAPIQSLKDIPEWNFDGSSTGQADGNNSEVWLRPVKYCKDPFRNGNNILVLCECLNANTMKPLQSNNRARAAAVFNNKIVDDEVPWFGIEQEYTLFESDGVTPLGYPFPEPQGPYYCSIGARRAFGRPIIECHYRACLYSGLTIAGINSEVMPGQWEFQIGPCVGIDCADQLWLARYLLIRIAEEFNVCVSFDPKPFKGDWNGAGAHTNYSTKSTRAIDGYKQVINFITKLSKNHKDHLAVYGENNGLRMTGKHETAHFDKFTYGVADRSSSVRIPRVTDMEKKGYFEDRRPAANCDPYLVTSIIALTTILDGNMKIADGCNNRGEKILDGDKNNSLNHNNDTYEKSF